MNGPLDDDDGSDIDDSDTDLLVPYVEPAVCGDVTVPCPVTITDSTSSFLEDMSKGALRPLRKPPAYCPECGGEMHLCEKCASGKVCTGEP